jgi:ABC-2 type transport system ATP-binding protein
MDDMIVLDKVTKRYGSFCAVNGISLQVRAGEIFGFLGVNGAGKTTTLRMLAGVLMPSEGRLMLGGYDLAEEPIKAKSITGYIPDRPYLYPKLTGREFLYFCADLYRVNQRHAEERIDQLLRDYTLLDWQDALIESYSHGMKQRLATCGALVHQPAILIVDEPIVGLDPHGARLLIESLKRYAREGMCILLSTHSLHVAEEVCDRLAIIHHGSLLTVGTLAEIRQANNVTHDRLEHVFIQLTSAGV